MELNHAGGPTMKRCLNWTLREAEYKTRNQTHLKECKYRKVQIFLVTNELAAH